MVTLLVSTVYHTDLSNRCVLHLELMEHCVPMVFPFLFFFF